MPVPSGLTMPGLVIDVFFVLDCYVMLSKPSTRSSLPSRDSLLLWLLMWAHAYRRLRLASSGTPLPCRGSDAPSLRRGRRRMR